MIPPKLPQPDSLAGRALKRMLLGEHITHIDFYHSTSSYRLSSSIYDLRQSRWLVDDLWESGPTADKTGRRASWKRYFIEPKELMRLRRLMGERLESFVTAVKKHETQL